MDQNYIRFEANYNGKLDQRYFTTIREYNAEDPWELGQEVEIRTAPRHELYTRARIVSTQVSQLRDLPDSFLMIDTGKCLKGAYELLMEFGIEPHDVVQVLTLENLEAGNDGCGLSD